MVALGILRPWFHSQSNQEDKSTQKIQSHCGNFLYLCNCGLIPDIHLHLQFGIIISQTKNGKGEYQMTHRKKVIKFYLMDWKKKWNYYGLTVTSIWMVWISIKTGFTFAVVTKSISGANTIRVRGAGII